MVNPLELKSIVLLTHLTPEMLDKVAALATIVNVTKGDYIFREGDYAEYQYSLLEGKVVLEVDRNADKPVRVKDIVPNHTFGISALVDSDEKRCISHAKTVVDSKLACWKASDLEKLFHLDNQLGFIYMKRITTILKDRLQIKNAQLSMHQ